MNNFSIYFQVWSLFVSLCFMLHLYRDMNRHTFLDLNACLPKVKSDQLDLGNILSYPP